MSSRHEKLYARLRAADDELRALFIARLREVAESRNTGFFVLHDGEPIDANRAVVTLAREVVELADQLAEPRSSLVAAMVLEAFEQANELSNEQRLGPIRHAQALLLRL